MNDWAYVELDTVSNFSFLCGASHPEELVSRAAALGYPALGIADQNSLSGVVRAHVAARHHGVRLIVGARLIFSDDMPEMIIYPKNIDGYRSLARVLSTGKIRGKKGKCLLFQEDIIDLAPNVIAIVVPPEVMDVRFTETLLLCKSIFSTDLFIAASFLYDGLSDENIAHIITLEEKHDLNIVVTNMVIAHDHTRRPVADIVACIKAGVTLHAAGAILKKNSERFLKSHEEMCRLFSHRKTWLKNTNVIARAISFSLDQLSYHYPRQKGVADENDYLWQETIKGAHSRYGAIIPQKIIDLITEEYALIRDLGYATYFLSIYDIVNFAKSRGILCQGRGSAANSAICYCLGITEVDPNVHELLFGRFISKERHVPPDIDVDFENGSREEVIQYIYQKYGRAHAAITGTVITYRKRMAVREVAKAFSLSLDAIQSLQDALRGISLHDLNDPDQQALLDTVAHDAGLANDATMLKLIISTATLLLRFPRHLGQHVGGFVINEYPLNELVPIGNAAMADRTFIEWDKDDLDTLGILKIDILALGMLSAIKRCFAMVKQHYGRTLSLSTIEQEDQNVYGMLSRADTIGVFQVESRSQMSMLPRLKPKTFYDLVIEVAIIRPGPIQGDMVHPYLRRRNGYERVAYPSAALKKVLARTLGIPLFQEQVMQVAIIGAGFSPGEADQLRRSMATFKRLGQVGEFHQRFITGMVNNGYQKDFAERIFNQILGFAEYGFPESHAASFANLVYASAWLKYYFPEAFACALLNSQPMGFYAPAQIIADAKRHGVVVLPIDINHSHGDHTLEPYGKKFAIRLGFSSIKGISASDIDWLVATRPKPGFSSIADVYQRSGLKKNVLTKLNQGSVFKCFHDNDREADWAILGLPDDPPPLLAAIIEKEDITVHLPKISGYGQTHRDYRHLGFSLNQHPLHFLRARLKDRGYHQARDLVTLAHGTMIKVAGLVIIRQRPSTAKGVVFFTLEDETGLMNIVIWPSFAEIHRKEVLLAPAVAIVGRLEKAGTVCHIITEEIIDISNAFRRLSTTTRNFR